MSRAEMLAAHFLGVHGIFAVRDFLLDSVVATMERKALGKLWISHIVRRRSLGDVLVVNIYLRQIGGVDT